MGVACRKNWENFGKFYYFPCFSAYNCEECGKSFYKRANLASHLLRHTADKKFRCSVPGCEKMFKRDKSLKHHLATMHTAEGKKPAFLCVFCGKSFGSFSGKYVQDLAFVLKEK